MKLSTWKGGKEMKNIYKKIFPFPLPDAYAFGVVFGPCKLWKKTQAGAIFYYNVSPWGTLDVQHNFIK